MLDDLNEERYIRTMVKNDENNNIEDDAPKQEGVCVRVFSFFLCLCVFNF